MGPSPWGGGGGGALSDPMPTSLGFDTSWQTYLPSANYDALRDPTLRHHFSNKVVRKQLRKSHLIDQTGRILDLEKHKSKLRIIDQVSPRGRRECSGTDRRGRQGAGGPRAFASRVTVQRNGPLIPL